MRNNKQNGEYYIYSTKIFGKKWFWKTVFLLPMFLVITYSSLYYFYNHQMADIFYVLKTYGLLCLFVFFLIFLFESAKGLIISFVHSGIKGKLFILFILILLLLKGISQFLTSQK
ncbi:hypothetical protein DCMF_21140 [Candidatus Formimonas warabiya]|uniref:Uncharacterized protein n=1 Tax=Formimonas warabiya TaxID=1761012 RepID=A0A3G1KX04_FORW1|nr:hypothetical protein DCMF_21140 [Candidatus Formimonas warabiya]